MQTNFFNYITGLEFQGNLNLFFKIFQEKIKYCKSTVKDIDNKIEIKIYYFYRHYIFYFIFAPVRSLIHLSRKT